MDMENGSCKLSRWQLLKGKLNNVAPDGLEEWLREHPQAILIDVRTPQEFQLEHLPGAINIDYLGEQFWVQLAQLDPQAEYLIYCRSGRRSVRTCTLLKNSKFERIYNLDGGLKATPRAATLLT